MTDHSVSSLDLTATLLDADGLERVLSRMAHDIVDAVGPQQKQLAIVGIRTGGAHLARRLEALLSALIGEAVPVGILDITLYRDDVLVGARSMPVLRGTDIPFDVEGRLILLVDDVLFSGRTIRAALDALLDLGRPTAVRLAVLIDRGRRELPISADFVGRVVSSEPNQRVVVRLTEEAAPQDEVVLLTSLNRRATDP